MKEFASALADFVPVVSWQPVMRRAGFLESWESEAEYPEPKLRIRSFPLQLGYSRFPISLISGLGARQTARMSRVSSDESRCPLICTTPYYAEVAERWRGPVIYYQTDLTFAYKGLRPEQVRALDTRLCRKATVVCPNSRRIAHYMVAEAKCDPAKIVIVPNATRQGNVQARPPAGPGLLPRDVMDLPRPIVGIIGNLAANLDWVLLREAVERAPQVSWLFVGPHAMDVPDPAHRAARQQLLGMGGRVRFAGAKPYGLLQEYARALDVALLPYRRKEPTFSGSSTRFYEHLAACRPMLATRGFEELIHKEPLLRLIDDADDLLAALRALQQVEFRDGWEQARWQASLQGTWSMRAATLIKAAQVRSRQALPSGELPAMVDQLISQGNMQGNMPSGPVSKFLLARPN